MGWNKQVNYEAIPSISKKFEKIIWEKTFEKIPDVSLGAGDNDRFELKVFIVKDVDGDETIFAHQYQENSDCDGDDNINIVMVDDPSDFIYRMVDVDIDSCKRIDLRPFLQ